MFSYFAQEDIDANTTLSSDSDDISVLLRRIENTVDPSFGMSRAKHWCFTLNNYTDVDYDRLSTLCEREGEVSYLVFGREVGDENQTPHLQGFISFASRLSFNTAKLHVGVTAHLEVARNVEKSIDYCKKDGDFLEFGEPPAGKGSRSDLDAFKDAVKEGMYNLKELRENHSEVYAKYTRFCLEYVNDHSPQRELPAHPLKDWQRDLNIILNQEPDDRSIYFLVDFVGNSGKTWFSHYYASLHKRVQVILPGKKADMAFVLDTGIRVLFVDAPRSKQGEFIQYDFLEDVKNGYVFSTKYESRVKSLGKVHVVVNMNEMPDLTKLSADRVKIIDIR